MLDIAPDPTITNGQPGEPPLVSIMLVNWNTREMTLECLRSVYAETREVPFEVILVDNGSNDGSADAIRAEFPQVVLMAESENHGFAIATNISVARARGRYVLLLNTDTLVLDGAIDKLLAFARRRPEAKIWGGRTLFEDRTLNPTSCWGRITPWSVTCMATGLAKAIGNAAIFNPEGYGGWDRGTERNVDIVQGSFFLIEKAFWDELGGFDPAFFMYGEEADLCARARAKGARPRMTPDATIVHYGGRSTKVFANKIVYVLGSRIGMIERYFPKGWKWYGKFMTLFWAGWRSFVYRVAARFSSRYRDAAEQWTNAWNRRNEWRNGPLRRATKG
ncbi:MULTISPECIES: glycosyltransferase family 2 protein [Novosphingobium]|uniref:glycosyltransferase family 2 protein n=1 Tax=Novosphingobium TaxID=165696 RepID=UPI000D6DC5CC|nr:MULTISPECIES: glycosyltransferase family 2 protein [Novosphingobium]